MSRVYTENVIPSVASGTAAYIWAFFHVLASTRVTPPDSASFGGTLLDYFINQFGTSDPYLPEEVDFVNSWSQWDEWKGEDTELHNFSALAADWPPPQPWAQTVDWNPLPQDNPRHRHFGRYRSRRS